MDDIIEQLLRGDMTNRWAFIESFMRVAKNTARRTCPDDDEAASEGYLVLCKIPDELAEGRYVNAPTEDEVRKYVITRVITVCRNWKSKNNLIPIYAMTKYRNPDTIVLRRKRYFFPGERHDNLTVVDAPIPVFDLLAYKEKEDTLTVSFSGLTGVEKSMIEDVKQGLSINEMATKYCVNRKTIRTRLNNLKNKIKVSQ